MAFATLVHTVLKDHCGAINASTIGVPEHVPLVTMAKGLAISPRQHGSLRRAEFTWLVPGLPQAKRLSWKPKIDHVNSKGILRFPPCF
jgi:hypothetical protein